MWWQQLVQIMRCGGTHSIHAVTLGPPRKQQNCKTALGYLSSDALSTNLGVNPVSQQVLLTSIQTACTACSGSQTLKPLLQNMQSVHALCNCPEAEKQVLLLLVVTML